MKASEGSTWGRGFDYDQYGNMWVDPSVALTYGIAPAGNTPTVNVYSGNRQTNCSQPCYDNNGNLTIVNDVAAAYDAENHISMLASGGTETFLYDGNGRRVEKTLPGLTVVYVYDASGQLASEYTTLPSLASPCSGTCYLAQDHLGSVRLVMDSSGNVVDRHDFLPFGEEIQPGVGARNSQWNVNPTAVNNIPVNFTGQLRDREVSLDYFGARYYGSALGRFTSPDEFKGGIVDPFTGQDVETTTALPYADITDPQTLNKYAYVRNNPLRYVDPNGHCIEDACILETAGATAVGGALLYYGYKLGVSIRDTLNSQFNPAPAYAASHKPIKVNNRRNRHQQLEVATPKTRPLVTPHRKKGYIVFLTQLPRAKPMLVNLETFPNA